MPSTSGKHFESWIDKWRSNLSSSSFLFFGTISITLFALPIKFVIGRSKFVYKISGLGGGCGGDDGGPGKIKVSSSSP